MRIIKVKIKNFRGIKDAELLLNNHTVLVGDNNTGKSSILEAIDLVLGPERLSRQSIIDEHDFYAGQYLGEGENTIAIQIEVLLIDLNEEQSSHFRHNIEWFNTTTLTLLEGPPPENTDAPDVKTALRVCFKGWYSEDDDDFLGKTYFASPFNDDESHDSFHTRDKRICGFLFLRTLRTGSRALSLEKGSLLDIILRLRELRPRMWEDVLSQLRKIKVAEDPELGISEILDSVHKMVRSFVSAEWIENPHMKVSNLTRIELRKVLNVFIGTGSINNEGNEYAAPFQHQGTGTINMLVLSLLVMIADLKQNVIFAMEEPEIAIPPHAQKRIVNRVTTKAAQTIFTSHSPYILEEFKPEQILVTKRENGVLTGVPANYPPAIKPKSYKEEFKKRFCEALLARRVMIVEGRTEFDTFSTVARRLHELNPDNYSSLEALGISVIDAKTDSQIEPLGKFFKGLGKVVFAVFDKQTPEIKAAIDLEVHHSYECPEKSIEKLIINYTSESSLRRYAAHLINNNEWPQHLASKSPIPTMDFTQLQDSLMEYFSWTKGSGTLADLLSQCSEEEMPDFIKQSLRSINVLIEGEKVETLIVE